MKRHVIFLLFLISITVVTFLPEKTYSPLHETEENYPRYTDVATPLVINEYAYAGGHVFTHLLASSVDLSLPLDVDHGWRGERYYVTANNIYENTTWGTDNGFEQDGTWTSLTFGGTYNPKSATRYATGGNPNGRYQLTLNGVASGSWYVYHGGEGVAITQAVSIPRGAIDNAWLRMDIRLDHATTYSSFEVFVSIAPVQLTSSNILSYKVYRWTFSALHGMGANNTWVRTAWLPLDIWINSSACLDEADDPHQIWVGIGMVFTMSGYISFSTTDPVDPPPVDYQQVSIDNFYLALNASAKPSQVDLDISVSGLPSVAFIDSGYGQGYAEQTHTWAVNPVIATVSTNSSITLDLSYYMNSTNTKTTNIEIGGPGGIKGIYDNGSDVEWYAYYNVYVPQGYTGYKFNATIPTDWSVGYIKNPIPSSVPYSGGETGDGYFGVSSTYASMDGWWEFKFISSNKITDAHTEKYTGTWAAATEFRPGDKMRIAITFAETSTIDATLTIFHPNGSIWISDNVTVTTGTVYKEYIIGGENTTGGIYKYAIRWFTDRAAGAWNGSFMVTHASDLILREPMEALYQSPLYVKYGDTIPLRVLYKDTDSGRPITGAIVNYTINSVTYSMSEVMDGIYEAPTGFNTSLLPSPGLYTIAFNASCFGFDADTYSFDIYAVLPTVLTSPQSPSISTPWNKNITLDIYYNRADNNEGISNATITINWTQPYSIKEVSVGHYQIELNTSLDIGSYPLEINASKPNYYPRRIVISVVILKRNTILAYTPPSETMYGGNITFLMDYIDVDERNVGIENISGALMIDVNYTVNIQDLGNGNYSITIDTALISPYLEELWLNVSFEWNESKVSYYQERSMVVSIHLYNKSVVLSQSFSSTAYFGEPYNITVFYTDAKTSEFIPSANIELVGISSGYNVIELSDRYIINIPDLSILGTTPGRHAITIRASKYNVFPYYSNASQEIYLDILPRPVVVSYMPPGAVKYGDIAEIYVNVTDYNGSFVIDPDANVSDDTGLLQIRINGYQYGTNYIITNMGNGTYKISVYTSTIGTGNIALNMTVYTLKMPWYENKSYSIAFTVMMRVAVASTIAPASTRFTQSIQIVIQIIDKGNNSAVSGFTMQLSAYPDYHVLIPSSEYSVTYIASNVSYILEVQTGPGHTINSVGTWVLYIRLVNPFYTPINTQVAFSVDVISTKSQSLNATTIVPADHDVVIMVAYNDTLNGVTVPGANISITVDAPEIVKNVTWMDHNNDGIYEIKFYFNATGIINVVLTFNKDNYATSVTLITLQITNITEHIDMVSIYPTSDTVILSTKDTARIVFKIDDKFAGISVTNATVKYKIIDAYGRILRSGEMSYSEGSYNVLVNVQGLPAGTYKIIIEAWRSDGVYLGKKELTLQIISHIPAIVLLVLFLSFFMIGLSVVIIKKIKKPWILKKIDATIGALRSNKPLEPLNIRERNDIISYLTAIYFTPAGLPPPRKVKVTRKDIELALQQISDLLKEEVTEIAPVPMVPVRKLTMEEIFLEQKKIKQEIDQIMAKARMGTLTPEDRDRARVLAHRLAELLAYLQSRAEEQ